MEEGKEGERKSESERKKKKESKKKKDETTSLTDSVWIRAACPTGNTGLYLALHLLRTSINSQ